MKWMVDFDAAEKAGWGFAPDYTRGCRRGVGFSAGDGHQGFAGRDNGLERRGWRNCSTPTITPTG